MSFVQTIGIPDTRYTSDAYKRVITTLEQWRCVREFFLNSKILVFDFETSGLAYYRKARSCGIALCAPDAKGRPYCVYLAYRHKTGEQQLDFDSIKDDLCSLLSTNSRLLIAHNIKFDEHFANIDCIEVGSWRYDTMVAAKLHNESRSGELENLAESELGISDAKVMKNAMIQERRRLAKFHGVNVTDYLDQYGYSEVSVHLCGYYACHDVYYTYLLWYRFAYEYAVQNCAVWQTEMDLTHILCVMESTGQKIDVPYISALRNRLSIDLAQYEQQIYAMAGRVFKISSNEQLIDYMWNTLGLRWQKTTKKDALAVDTEVLSKFAHKYPIIASIARYRVFHKIYSTYTQSILDRLDSSHFLHGSFRQVGTVTGRMASAEPNLQNFPNDDYERAVENGGLDPYSIRRCFVTRGDGWVRLYFDYSQIELRVIAEYSRDPIMLETYLDNGDIHTRTALEVFGDASKPFRSKAKVINFGIPYGMSPAGYARNTGTSIEEGERFLGLFFERYSGITKFKSEFFRYLRSNGGYFLNLFGRPRTVYGFDSNDRKVVGAAERQAISSIIQGSAAELTKLSLVRVYNFIKECGVEAYLTTTIHDELQIDCKAVDVNYMVPNIIRLMQDFESHFRAVPIIVSAEVTSTSWAEKKGLEVK